jgi:hypothetical protein
MTARLSARSVSTFAAAIALVPCAFAATVSVEQLEREEEAIQLVGRLEKVAREVRSSAARLNSLARNSSVSRWPHIHHLGRIKELVNQELRPALSRLAELQPQLPEWKRQSIDQMLDAARTLAADTNSAIISKNGTGTLPLPMNAEYRGFIDRVYQHAGTLVRTSDAAGHYALARYKAAAAGIEVPRS